MNFESKTPTHKKFGAPIDELINNFEERGHEDDFTFDEANRFLNSIALLVECQDSKADIKENLSAGLSILQSIAEKHPDITADLRNALTNLTLGVFCAANEIACQKIEREAARMPNLSQFAAAKAEDEAVRRAKELWSNDTDQDLRIGQAAKIILHELDRNGFGLYVEKTVRGWIRPVAPAYATRGGRPKKI